MCSDVNLLSWAAGDLQVHPPLFIFLPLLFLLLLFLLMLFLLMLFLRPGLLPPPGRSRFAGFLAWLLGDAFIVLSSHYSDTFLWELASANWDLTMAFPFLIRS